MKNYRSLAVTSLAAWVGLSCPPAAARETGEARGRIHVRGWVSPVCRLHAPELRPEGEEAEPVRLIVTLRQVCNTGAHQVWLHSAAGVDSVRVSNGARLAPPTAAAPALVTASLQSAPQLVVRLDRKTAARRLTLRVQPIL